MAGCTAVLAAGPALFDSYWLRVLTGGLPVRDRRAGGLNIIAGYTGYPAFGNVVFFGIGAYWTGVLMVGLPVALRPATLAALLFAMRSSARPCCDCAGTTSRSGPWLSTRRCGQSSRTWA